MKENYIGAIVVLENFLDGAVADYESGNVEDNETIWSCINAIKKLGGRWYYEYEERMIKAEELRNDQN